MSRTQCYEWLKRFKESRMSVGEDHRSGRLSTSTNDDYVERVRAVIRGNRRLTVREVVDEVGVKIGSCHQMVTGKLQIRCVSAKFVPSLFDRRSAVIWQIVRFSLCPINPILWT
jgi:hypothetical protein